MTFSSGLVVAMVLGWGHSIGTATGLLLRTVLCKSLVLMRIESNSSKYTQNMHAKKAYSVRILKQHKQYKCKIIHNRHKTSFTYTHY